PIQLRSNGQIKPSARTCCPHSTLPTRSDPDLNCAPGHSPASAFPTFLRDRTGFCSLDYSVGLQTARERLSRLTQRYLLYRECYVSARETVVKAPFIKW